MTFADILADVYRRCGYATSPATDVVTRLKAFVNETYQELVGEPGMQWLTNNQLKFSSIAAQAEYSVATSVGRIKAIRDVANRRTLIPMSLDTYRNRFPSPATDSGVPEYYVDLGLSTQQIPLTIAQALTIVSSSGSDTGTVYVRGFRTGGIPFSQGSALTGITPVNINSGTSDIVEITDFWIDAAPTGTISLKNGAGTAVATIYPAAMGQTSVKPHYRNLALVPTPVGIVEYSVDYEREFADLVQPSDEPLLPSRFHRTLASGTRAKEYEKLNQLQRMAVARADYLKGLADLKYYVYTQAVGTPNLRSNSARRTVASAVNVATS